MPFLDIADLGLSDPASMAPGDFEIAWFRVRAAMIWPQDISTQARAVGAMFAEWQRAMFAVLESDTVIPLRVRDLRTLMQGAVDFRDLEGESETRQRRGQIAGAVLIDALLDHWKGRPPKLAGIFKSVAERFELSEGEVRTVCWPSFRSVAHLWGTTHQMKRVDVLPRDLGELLRFIAFAEQLRALGETTPVRGGTLLRSGEMWKVPQGVDLVSTLNPQQSV